MKCNNLHCSIEISKRVRSGFCKKCLHNIICKRLYHTNDYEKERRKRWKKENRKHIYKRQRERENSDVLFKLKRRLRHRLYMALKRNHKSGSAIKDLGCSINEFKNYLELKFKPNMTWDNYGKEWEIDHVMPLYKFDLTVKEELLLACHYTNLQPLWKKDHFVKSAQDLKGD
jgi:hypothetical protein